MNELIDGALEELAACDRLVVDLRGNGGGSLIEASMFRDRFLDRPRQLGTIETCGSPSGGGSGRARAIRLLEDIDLHVSTALTYDRDGHCIEGAGIPVDLPVELPPDQDAWTVVDDRW